MVAEENHWSLWTTEMRCYGQEASPFCWERKGGFVREELSNGL